MRKLPVLLFVIVLSVYTLYPSVEAVRQSDVLGTVSVNTTQNTNAAVPEESESVDFSGESAPVSAANDPQSVSAEVAEPVYDDAVVRYTDTPAQTQPEATLAPTPVPTPQPTPIAKGMSSPDISEYQAKLVQWGFMEAEPDGIYGSDTEEAVIALQNYLSALEVGASAVFEDENVYGDGVVEALSSGESSEPTPEPTPQVTPAPAYPATGIIDAKLIDVMNSDFQVYHTTIASGSEGLDAQRVQRKLIYLGYLYKGADDGVFGDKTAKTLSYFQKLNNIPETGIADKVTQEVLFSDSAVKSDKPYHPYAIKVDISEQRLYVYAWSNGGYTKLVKKVKCSTGLPKTPTPTGTFQDSTGPGKRWHYFKDFACWAQYAFYIQGDIMIHSVIYNKKGGNATYGSVHSLGKRASHGCVRVAVKDAKWIWENCEVGTTVVVQK